jgi:hypothetical protein
MREASGARDLFSVTGRFFYYAQYNIGKAFVGQYLNFNVRQIQLVQNELAHGLCVCV